MTQSQYIIPKFKKFKLNNYQKKEGSYEKESIYYVFGFITRAYS